MTLVELTDYYAGLLAYQYRGQANASRQMKILTKQAVADYLAAQLVSCFDIETAVGTQLDVLGKYIGVSRNVGIVLVKPYFGFWGYGSTLAIANYQGTWIPATNTPSLPAAAGGNTGWWYVVSESGVSTAPIAENFEAGDIIYSNGSVWAKRTDNNGNGFTTYNDYGTNQQGLFYSYSSASGQNSDLTDEQYRAVLKLKISLNSNDGTLASIMAYLNKFFPGLITLTDNTDMTMDYVVLSTVALSKELLEIYLPKPMGVGITVTIVTPSPVGGDRLTTEDGFVLTTEDGSPLITESP